MARAYCALWKPWFGGLFERNVPYAAMLFIPSAAKLAADLYEGEIKEKTAAIINGAAAVLCAGLIIFGAGRAAFSLAADRYPVKAAEFIITHLPPTRGYNDQNLGSYLIWAFHGTRPVFLDSRMGPKGLVSAVLLSMAAAAGFSEIQLVSELVYSTILFSIILAALLSYLIEKGKLNRIIMRAFPAPEKMEEEHAAADDKGIDDVDEVIEHHYLVGHFRAADDGEEGPLGIADGPVQKFQFLLHEKTHHAGQEFGDGGS